MAKDNLLRLGKRADPKLPACMCGGTGYVRVSDEGQGTVSPCAGCASARIVRQFGGEPHTWSNWHHRPELEVTYTMSLRVDPATQAKVWTVAKKEPTLVVTN